MADELEENELMRSVALQNAQSIFLARQRAERDLLQAKEALERKTEELAQQREWFRVTLSSIGDAVITTDTQARITFLNPVAETLTGWTSAEAAGQPLETVFNIINEDTREPVQNPVGKVLREGVIVGLANHTTLLAKNGTPTPIEDSAAPIRDVSGKTTGAVMVFHDVTERRHTERALRESDARLSLAMEAGQMGAWEWMVKTGKVTWSPTLEAIHGLAPGTFDGTFEAVQREMHPEDRDRALATIQKGLVQGGYRTEYRIVKPDGEVAWIEARGRTFSDPHGKPERMAGICMDITAQKRAEDALRESEEFNRTIIESSRDCTKTLSLDGVLLWMSDTAQKTLCISDLHEVIGKPWVQFWQDDDQAAAAAAIKKAAAGGTGSFVGCYEVLGQPRCWDVVVTPILDRSGKPEKLLAISRDVTERRKLDEVHARLAAVVEFSDDAIVSKNLEGTITTWNRGAERIFGYTAQEAIGRSVMMLIPPDRASEEPRILDHVKRGEAILPYETERVTKSGRRIFVSLTVSPIKNTAGEIIGVSKIARDITAQKQAAAEKARLTSILEKSLNEIYIFDTGELHFQYVNHGALRNLGYTMEQMRNLTPLDLKPSYTEAAFREMVQPLLRGEKEKLVFYTDHRRADGSLYPVEVHLQSVSHAGQPVFLAVILDITERQKVEKDRERLLLLEQDARARALDAENRERFLA
jgi:PAS domain S-box-containing protein